MKTMKTTQWANDAGQSLRSNRLNTFIGT